MVEALKLKQKECLILSEASFVIVEKSSDQRNKMTIDDRKSRVDAISGALKSYRENNERRTETVEFRGQDRSLEVVRVNPIILLLNPNNSRIRAQLEDHPMRDLVIRDSFSSEAQQVIADLLRKTEKFKNLKSELSALKQKSPGIVSRDGLLINGNTRVVALRDLGADGVDVAVLPEDATTEDFLDIEMNQQMMRLTHQDYSFTNELLLMKEYLRLGHTPKQLGLKMGWVNRYEAKINQSMRMLEMIDQVRKLSETHLPYSEFDSKRQHLKDLDDAFELKKTQAGLEAAERMKWSRLAGMLLGANKDQVRTIDEDFFNNNVKKRVQGKKPVADLLKKHERVSPPDTFGGLIDEDPKPTEKIDMKGFVKSLLNDDENRSSTGEVVRDLEGPIGELAEAVRRATLENISEENLESFKTAASGKLQEARFRIESVIENIGQASALEGFNFGAFENELKVTGEVLERLERLFNEIKVHHESSQGAN